MPWEVLLDSGPEPTPEQVLDSDHPVFFAGNDARDHDQADAGGGRR
jgi:hypothetical protein